MAALIFTYATMNAGKSTALLQAAYNFRERGLAVMLLTAAADRRAGLGTIRSRIGLSAEAEVFEAGDDLFARVEARLAAGPLHRLLVDEAQFLAEPQVWQLARVADRLGVEVSCYGLRTDFLGHLFPGSAALLALADDLRPLHTVCFCGREATMVRRVDADGTVATRGAQVQIGGNESYVPLCRLHWTAAAEEGLAGF